MASGFLQTELQKMSGDFYATITLLALAWIIAELYRAPVGYETETGFMAGRRSFRSVFSR